MAPMLKIKYMKMNLILLNPLLIGLIDAKIFWDRKILDNFFISIPELLRVKAPEKYKIQKGATA